MAASKSASPMPSRQARCGPERRKIFVCDSILGEDRVADGDAVRCLWCSMRPMPISSSPRDHVRSHEGRTIEPMTASSSQARYRAAAGWLPALLFRAGTFPHAAAIASAAASADRPGKAAAQEAGVPLSPGALQAIRERIRPFRLDFRRKCRLRPAHPPLSAGNRRGWRAGRKWPP